MQQNLDFQKFEKESANDTFEENKPAKKPKPNLSQSLLKAYVDYYDENVKGCGLQIRKQYFEKLPTPSSEAAKLGIYFEYKATDYVREGDPIPQPKMVYAGTAKEKFAVDYERAAELRDEIARLQLAEESANK